MRDILAAPKSWRFSEQQGHSLTLPPGALGSFGCRQLATPLWPLGAGTASAEQRPLQSRASGKARPGVPPRCLPELSRCAQHAEPCFFSAATWKAPGASHTSLGSPLSPARPGPAGAPKGAEQCGREGESGVSEHGSDRSSEPLQTRCSGAEHFEGNY